MQEASIVLMVSGGGMTYLALRKVLDEAGVQVHLAGSCAEAEKILKALKIPAVLFSDTALPDGTWLDVLSLATQARWRVPVIVVSRVVDINLYISALEYGASDFIVPPFYRQDISHVLMCATQKGAVMPRLAAA